jgi:hypothetical protein
MDVDRAKVAFDKEVGPYVYGRVMQEGLPPTIAETASALSVARELRRVGFRVRTVRGYGRYRLPRARAAFIAHKPA